GELELVVLVLGRRLAEHDRVPPLGRRVSEEPEGREEAGRLVVADVGRDHVAYLILLIEEEDDPEEADRIPLVRVGDELGERDEASFRPAGRGCGERSREGEPFHPGAGGGTLVSTHRSP